MNRGDIFAYFQSSVEHTQEGFSSIKQFYSINISTKIIYFNRLFYVICAFGVFCPSWNNFVPFLSILIDCGIILR